MACAEGVTTNQSPNNNSFEIVFVFLHSTGTC